MMWVLSLMGTFFFPLVLLLLLVAPGGRPFNFPPGLPILPVVGSLLTLRGGPTRRDLSDLRGKYGNIASFAVLGTRVVLVSGLDSIREVFSHKATSARPDSIFGIISHLVSDGRLKNLGLMGSSGEAWQEQRRFLLHHLRNVGFGKNSHEPVMAEEITELLDRLAREQGRPVAVNRLFNLCVLNMLWRMVVGKRYSLHHPRLNLLLDVLVHESGINPLAPVFFLPGLFWILPRLPFFRKAAAPLIKVIDFIKDEIREVQEDEVLASSGTLVATYLKEIEKHRGEASNFHMEQLTALVLELFVAGNETTSHTLCMGVNLIASHPEIQRRMQEELDAVVESGSLPSLADQDRLPFTQAAVHEVQRFFRHLPYSGPRVVTHQCSVAGFTFPPGTVLLANLNDVMTDPRHWKNPEPVRPRELPQRLRRVLPQRSLYALWSRAEAVCRRASRQDGAVPLPCCSLPPLHHHRRCGGAPEAQHAPH